MLKKISEVKTVCQLFLNVSFQCCKLNASVVLGLTVYLLNSAQIKTPAFFYFSFGDLG